MSQESETLMLPTPANQTTCSNCHSIMPAELRFCRNCGFRLTTGAGVYTGTQYPEVSSAAAPAATKKKRRMSGLSWIFIGLLVFFVGAAAFTALIAPRHIPTPAAAPVVKSFVGVNGFNDSDRGVTFESVSVPNGPADKAGLVGGDVIMKVDGQDVRDEDHIDEIMTQTPVGKTIEIEYLRDGEKKTTKLTTISQDENRRLNREYERRPEGRGVFGYEDGDAERVQVPGTDLYGVKLGTVYRSRPADMAGVKSDDIAIEFDGIPIRTPEEFRMRVGRALPYSTIKLVVMRSEGEGQPFQKVEIPVKMGKQ